MIGVLVCGLHLPPDYVMDRMGWYEIRAYLKYMHYNHKDDWEQTRWLGNLFINANSKRRYDLDETIPFYWENMDDDGKKKSNEPTEVEMKNAFHNAQKMGEILKKQTDMKSVTLKDFK